MVYWLIKLFYSNQDEFTYHYSVLDCFKNKTNNENYHVKGLIGETNINETM